MKCRREVPTVNSHGRKAVGQSQQINDEARRADSEGHYRSFGPPNFVACDPRPHGRGKNVI